MIVIHCTELPDLDSAREYGEKIHYSESETGNSGHFYIDRDGTIEQYVELDRIAHHVRGHNKSTIGIELVNLGRYPHWHDSRHQAMTEAYPEAQLLSLIWLVQQLSATTPSIVHITGHEDLDQSLIQSTDQAQIQVRRKLDPGDQFPWSRLLQNLSLSRPEISSSLP